MRHRTSTAVIASIVALSAGGASAQTLTLCAPRTEFLAGLRQQFNEEPVGRGLTATGTVLELLVSPEASWTVLITFPSGVSCMATAGEQWERLEPSRSARVKFERLGLAETAPR